MQFIVASKGKDPSYVKEAYELESIWQNKATNLYLSWIAGIMGAIQDGVLDHGGKAIGVMPRMLDEREITSQK